jgi:hypothetical protein
MPQFYPAKKTFACFSLFFLILYTGYTASAQTPGGIATGSTLWLKGNYSTAPVKMTFSSGNLVNGWRDEKSTYNLTQATVAKQPAWYDGSSAGSSSDSLNYNPHVKFTYSLGPTFGTLLANANTSTNLLGTSGTIILVLNDDNAFRTAITYYSNTLYRYQVKQTFRAQTSDGIAVTPTASALGYTNNFASTAYNSPSRNARIIVIRGFGGSLTARRNSTTTLGLEHNNVLGYLPGIIAGINLGGNPGVSDSEPFNGRIAETILYNTTLSNADVQKIESYLALKYGVTLNPAGLDATNGYISSAGTSLYSQGVDGTNYWNNVIGLGRDDNSGLLQKQSHQYDDTVRLYSSTLAATNASNTSALTNNTFMMMGSNRGKMCENAATAAEVPSPYLTRIGREWKLINTGYNNTYSIDFKLANCINGALWDTGVRYLLADNDADLTNSTPILSGTNGVSITYNSAAQIITVTIDPTAAGSLFPTNGTPKFITPAVAIYVLPQQMLSFTAAKISNRVKLNWTTIAGQGLDRFEIEKSTNNTAWEKIGVIAEIKNTIAKTNYEFIDNHESSSEENIYYRIKQIGINGEVSYSPVQLVRNTRLVSVYPNPATKSVTINWSGHKQPQQIKLFNLSGKEMNISYSANATNAELNINHLPAGVYILALTINNTTTYSKLLKQ